MGFYIESADRPYQSGVVSEDMKVGTLAVDDGDGTISLADAQSNSDFDGVVASPRRSNYIAEREYEETNFTYLVDTSNEYYEALISDGAMTAPYGGGADGDVINVRTIEETTSGVTTAPNITDGDVVGFVDTSDADAPTSAGRIVEEGYTNDENDDASTTTYNEANNNFVAIGKAYRPNDGEGTAFDGVVRVKVDA